MSNLSVNAIRFLGIDAINKANSGHPGVVMGAAPMAYSLFTKQLRINPAQPNWINRDRFILSACLLYTSPRTYLCPPFADGTRSQVPQVRWLCYFSGSE